MTDPPKQLNLGCGFDHRDGYLNVDFEPAHNPDVVADVRVLDGLADGTFTEILAQDVLEHLTRDDAEPALRRWNELLTVGGTLTIRTTDIIGLCGMLSHHRDPKHQFELLQNLFGTQAYEGDYHLNGFTESSLRSLLHTTGFEVTSMTRFDGWLLDCEAHKPSALGPLDLGPLPLMDMPSFGDPAPPERHGGAIDRAVSRVAVLVPDSMAGVTRSAWRRARAAGVRGVNRTTARSGR